MNSSNRPFNLGKLPVFLSSKEQLALENIHFQIRNIVLAICKTAKVDTETIYTLIVYMQIGIIKAGYSHLTIIQAYNYAVEFIFYTYNEENTQPTGVKITTNKDVLDSKELLGQNQNIFIEIVKDIWQPDGYNTDLIWLEAWEQSCANLISQLDFRPTFVYLTRVIYEQVGLAAEREIPPLSLELLTDLFPASTQNISIISFDETDILNLLIEKFNYTTFLWVGMSRPDFNFDCIDCIHKSRIDHFPPREDIASEQYFSQSGFPEKVDLIFIDGIRHHEDLIRDINNALRRLSENGTIVCHNILPENDQIQADILKNESWKAWAYFRMTRIDLSMHVINDLGLGIVKRGEQQIFRPPKPFFELDFSFYRNHRSELMNVVDISEFKKNHKMFEVSVIIPNYNHAPYLKQRIDTVLNQTYQQFELIILDDCSVDNSKNIIESYKNHPKVTAIIYNEVNSGSTFKQWEKGILLAKGMYVWIAESDDWCEPTFLEHLMEGLSSNNCVISYCQSYCIRDNNILRQSMTPFLSQYKNGRSFIKSDMLYGNSIFNASMALWKRSVFFDISKDFTELKFCGDWLFWIELCLKGDIHISGRVLNYFRKHDNDVSGKAYGTGFNFIEEIKVLNSLLQKRIVTMEEYENAISHKHIQFKTIEQHLDQETRFKIGALFQDAKNISN